jgi:hypothetical protein
MSAPNRALKRVLLFISTTAINSYGICTLNLPDLELAVEPHCWPAHLLETLPASLLSTHRELWRSRI